MLYYILYCIWMHIVGTAERQMLCHIFTELPTHKTVDQKKPAKVCSFTGCASRRLQVGLSDMQMKWKRLPLASALSARIHTHTARRQILVVAPLQWRRNMAIGETKNSFFFSRWNPVASACLVAHTITNNTYTHPPAAHAWCIIRYCAPRNTKNRIDIIPKQHASFEPQFTHSTCEAVRRVTANTHKHTQRRVKRPEYSVSASQPKPIRFGCGQREKETDRASGRVKIIQQDSWREAQRGAHTPSALNAKKKYHLFFFFYLFIFTWINEAPPI